MKKFFLDYGYSCVKMFVDQFAIALFGMSLAIAVSGLEYEKYGWLVYAVSVFSVLFYFVLIYSIPWNHGAKDRISVDYKKKERNLPLGLYMGLVANIPNMLVALLTALFTFVGSAATSAGLKSIGIALQGMYLGLLQIKIGDTPLNAYWWMLLVIMIPSVIVSSVAYIAGFYNVRVFKFKEKRQYY